MSQSTIARSSRPNTSARYGARSPLSLAAMMVLAALASASAGCYERTIRSTGINSSRDTIQEPYQSDWWIDRQIFRDRP
ncbi:MAG: hypothetical protein ACK55O_11070 [Phycisphaerales bacterium]|jgi:hypothetical protein|nr:hypothetical protein [Phycisphaeraceae bacterium]